MLAFLLPVNSRPAFFAHCKMYHFGIFALRHRLFASIQPLYSSTFFQTMPSMPPIAAPPTTLRLPDFYETSLQNGIKLITVEDDAQPLLTMSIVSRNGAAEDEIWGETNFMTSLMNKGTTKRNAQTLADEIDFTGGSLSASCVFDSLSSSLSVLSDFTEQGLELLADMTLRPSFPGEEIERVRQQTLVEIDQANNDAGYLSSIALTQGLFKGQKYGHPVIGTQDIVRGLGQSHCRTAYERSFQPKDVFIAAAGKFRTDELRDRLNTHFAEWTSHAPSPIPNEQQPDEQLSPVSAQATKIMLIEKPDAAQTSLRVGFLTAGRHDVDFIPMQMLNTIFGGSFISRLNHNLREEKGYTYGVHSSVDSRKYASSLTVGTHVGSEVVENAVSEILREIELLRTEPVSDEELETTRKYIIGSFALRTETPTQVVSLASTLELYGLPKDYHAGYLARLATISKEELFAVQQRRFSTQNLVIAAAGTVEFLREKLQQFGAVSVVDANGKVFA
ncbi:MAG: insulinase family protein [Candidatus Kapaibacterium sp.]|nr:MAG: insulinase family protein [Candidatus Kapabacteria bacterium]